MENIKLFKKALKFVLKWEGGYGHNPNDKGGATNKGITQYTYNAWLKEHKLQQKKRLRQGAAAKFLFSPSSFRSWKERSWSRYRE